MSLITEFGLRDRASIIERAKQLYHAKDCSWDNAMRVANREATAELAAQRAAHLVLEAAE